MHRVTTHYTTESENANIAVYVRARPLDDESAGLPSDFLSIDETDERRLNVKDPESSQRRYGEANFQFDRIFWTNTPQEEVFQKACRPQIEHVLNGYNSCCFAYGQTGSGKTYTMFGEDNDSRGIIPRSVEYIFQALAKRSNSYEVAMVCSFLEIYNDQIRDLGKAYLVAMSNSSDENGNESKNSALFEKTSDLYENLAAKRGNPYFAPAFHRPKSSVANNMDNRPGLREVQEEYNHMNYEIREDLEGNVFVKDLSLVPVTTSEEVMNMINMGIRVRATHETKMNAVSSRSHTVFTITILQKDKITGQSITGMLNLVDLAGSERLKKSESQGIRLKEALHINSSLTALGKVIIALNPSLENSHIPYRDSKLTRLLQNSLGGNSFTSVIAAIHPSPKYYDECLSTLQFANRCRSVKNNPKVNYVEENEDKDRKIKRLVEELNQVRMKLNQLLHNKGGAGSGGNGDGFSITKLLSVLKSLGLNASLSPDGDGIIINGKKYTLDELGVLSGSNSSNDLFSSTSDFFNGSGGNNDKLMKQLKELKESNELYKNQSKERKNQLNESNKELSIITNDLVKLKTSLIHKENEYVNLLNEKDRALTELKNILEAKHKEEIDNLLKTNLDLIKEQEINNNKIPASLKEYTQLIKEFESMKESFEGPLRKEFDNHLYHLEKCRQNELNNLKKQYEHWMCEKDKALSGFVDAFNLYRNKKIEQLTMAEGEIVRLYDYTEQLETILDNVEKGKYSMKQKQGLQGGKSATGVLATLKSNSHQGSYNDDDEGEIGAVVLPKGLRPVNPLKLVNLHGDNGLELTKKIVKKHKERSHRMEKMKEEAFQKSLQYAAQIGATATGEIDEALQKQVRDLLIKKSPRSLAAQKRMLEQNEEKEKEKEKSPTFPAINSNQSNQNNKSRPISSGSILSSEGSGGAQNFRQQGLSTAPGNLQVRNRSLLDSNVWNDDDDNYFSNNKNVVVKYEVPPEILKELEDLRHQVSQEKISTEKVLADLSSNETFQYINQLENEVEYLRKQLKEASQALQGTKVANASLSRTLNTPTGSIILSSTLN